jgi:prepilin-type N-terminal cleavage/methylation domain-containing protein
MKNKKNLFKKQNCRCAFTLIEMLVVVLIIGILAAITLPQYQKAVYKSNAAGAVSKINTLYNALERYRLTNGRYPAVKSSPAAEDFNAYLDIETVSYKNATYFYYSGSYVSINFSNSGIHFSIAKGLGSDSTTHVLFRRGVTSCWAYDTQARRDKAGRDVCKTLCGAETLTPDAAGAEFQYCLM